MKEELKLTALEQKVVDIIVKYMAPFAPKDQFGAAVFSLALAEALREIGELDDELIAATMN